MLLMHLSKFFFPHLYLGMGEGGDGSTSGSSGDPNSSNENKNQDEVARMRSENEKLKQELEEMRMEVVTPEYLEFLGAKEKGSQQPKQDVKQQGADDLSKLSPTEIYQKAMTDLRNEMKAEVDKIRKGQEEAATEATKKEVAAFARTHDDFEKFRPIMYGLSLDPKNKDLSLQELYSKAKEHVKSFGPSEDDKNRSRRSSGEKPGGSSGSFDPNKKYSAEEAATESWDQVVGNEGLVLD